MHARLILNGKKADRPDVREVVKAVRNAGHDLDVRVTWERGDAVRLVAEAAREGVSRVIAGGGDGSVNEVANGLMAVDVATRPALGILPLGTANDFATACRVPAEADAALLSYLEARGLVPGAKITVLSRSTSLDSLTLDGPIGKASLGLRPAALVQVMRGAVDASLFHQIPARS
jgi:hypothetical protein